MTKHINTMKTLFSQLSAMEHNIKTKERVELLLQNPLDSYDHLIINVANGALKIMLIFNDVVTTTLEKESRHKNKEDKISSSQQIETLIISKRRLREYVVLMGVTTKTGQSPRVRRKLNAIIVKSKST